MAGVRKQRLSGKVAKPGETQSTNKATMKRSRASDFAVGKKKKQKIRRSRVGNKKHASEKDGESLISELLSEVAKLRDENAEQDGQLDSDIEALKEAVNEARNADENEESDQNSCADSDESEDEDKHETSETRNASASSSRNVTNDGNESDDSSSDSDVDMASHRVDLEELQKSDPNFYKYLKENDAELLEFGHSDAEDGADGEEFDAVADDDESGSESEKLTAAEAGLDDAPQKVEKEKKIKVVDMEYLRNLQSDLAKARTALNASQDLLRLFRSGRELAVSNKIVSRSKKKAAKAKKQSKRKASGTDTFNNDYNDDDDDDDIDEELAHDEGYDAGMIRFVSAKAYQKAMNMAIIGIQETLDNQLGKPGAGASTKSVQEWSPREHKRWKNLEPMFLGFVYHLITLTEHMTDARTLRFLLKRLLLLIPYTKEMQSLTRKLVNVALAVWSGSDRDVSRPTKLRAFFLLHALGSESENTEVVLRKTCASFTKKVSTVCNSRTLPNIHFSIDCMVELFGIDIGASYSVVFTYLREIAVTLRAVLTCKDIKSEIDRLYNWKIINAIRLWSKVLARYGSEDELASLIYPFVQVSLGLLRLPYNPTSYPLRLHVCSFIIDLTSETGVFVPVPPHLLAILRCAELKRNPKRGALRPLDWRALLRVEDEVVTTKPYLGGVVRGVVFQLAKYFASISKHVSFPEIAHGTIVELQKVAKEIRVTEWKRDVHELRDQLKKTTVMVVEARAKSGLGPRDALGEDKMGHCVKGLTEKKMPIQRLYEVEKNRKAREERLGEDEKHDNKSTAAVKVNHNEVESGREEHVDDVEPRSKSIQ